MINNLRSNLITECGLSNDEAELALLYFIPQNLHRGENILNAGDMCDYAIFVSRGCLRSYVINRKGKESTMYLFPDQSWVPDMHCFLKNLPTTMSWDAVEDTIVYKLHRSGYEKLLTLIPSLPLFFQSLQYNYMSTAQRRLLTTLYTKAEDRYQSFLDEFPILSRRLPINLIASYIGIAPESLSRIRKQIIRK